MRAFFIIITMIASFNFISCKKKPKVTKISGIVLDYGTNEPIEDVKIFVNDRFVSSGPFTDSNFGTDAEATVFTDKDGKFDVEIDAEYSVSLIPSKDSEYWSSDDRYGYSIGTITEDEVIKLKAKAWFAGKLDSDIHVDSVRFKPVLEDFTVSGLFNKEFYGKGVHELTTIKPGRIAIGNTFFRYQIEYKDTEGKWNSFIDSVYIKKGDVFTGTLKY